MVIIIDDGEKYKCPCNKSVPYVTSFFYLMYTRSITNGFLIIMSVHLRIGKFPYSSLTEKDLLRLLKKGHRLEQPENCSQEM